MARQVLCPVLVRREDQLAILEEALLATHRGEGRFVVVAGEAGIGKTRLVSELSEEAERLGSTVLWGGCSEAELSLPYLPFVEAIGNHLAATNLAALAERLGPARAPLAQLFPQFAVGETPERPADPGEAKLRLFEGIVSLLRAVAEERPLVLVIEDVHWADKATRELLDHFARRMAGVPALVVVTYRSDELHRRHPFVPTLRAWERSGLAEVVALEPLPVDGVGEMVAAILETPDVDRALSEALYERTEGNPFVLEEMLREAADEGAGAAAWDRASLDRMSLPETVRETILLRLGRIDPGHVAILESAAVLGRSFDYPTLVEVADAGPVAVEAALQAAVAEQLVEEEADGAGRYRWRHALTQEAIYTDIVTPRRQAFHACAAKVLAESGSARPVDLAHHLLGAGRFNEAVPVCLQSAEEAENALAFGEAISMLERALPHISDPLQRARVTGRIGSDHWLNGESRRAERFLADAIAALDELGAAREAARLRIVHGRCLWEGEQPDASRAEYERAREVLEAEGPSADLAMAHVRLAGLDAFELDYEGCLRHARRAVEIAEAAGADFERVWGLGFVALGLLDSGDHEHGFEVMDACITEAVEKGYRFIAGNMAWNEVWTRVHMMEGLLDERLERFADLPTNPSHEASLAILVSYVALAQGDLERAREEAERTLELHRQLDNGKMAWRSRIQLAQVLTELGDLARAGSVLPEPSARTELQDIVYDAAAQIRYRLARGEIGEAAELAEEVLEHAEALAVYREALAIACEALVAAGRIDRAARLPEIAAAHESSAGQSFIDEMRGRVLLARGDGAAAAPLLAAAADAAQRVGYPLLAMRRRIAHTEAAAATGDRDGAERELRAVAAEADRLGAALVRSEAEAAAARVGIGLPPRPEGPPTVEPAEPDAVAIGERLVTSLFADVRGYTELTASASPEELASRMAALYRFATTAVTRHGGIVDKFAGDAVMATFNVSGTRVDHCIDAIEAALALRDKARLIDLELGIGIAVGPAVLARGASAENMSVRGEATNMAARLQAAAEGGEILLSAEAHRRVVAWLEARGLEASREELELKGFDRPSAVYRLRPPVVAPT